MYSKELIRKIHQSLPQELLDPIASDSTMTSVESISTANDLSVEQMKSLLNLIMYRLMGIIKKEDLASKIESTLQVNRDLAIKINREIYEKIISKIPPSILEKQERNAEEIAKGKTESPEALTGPIVITPETKKTVMADLARRVEAAKQEGASVRPPLPKRASEIHPMVEAGEMAHAVPHVESQAPIQKPGMARPVHVNPSPQTSTAHYEPGKDPYREPMQ